jgi:hypothetical protein
VDAFWPKTASLKSTESGTEKNRRSFVGGSDVRIIMGDDEKALVRLWREKRGEVPPKDLSGNLIVQLGVVTEILLSPPSASSGAGGESGKAQEVLPWFTFTLGKKG